MAAGAAMTFEERVHAELAAAEGGGDGGMRRCGTCGRSFNPDALAKHQSVCKKVFVQKRKAFDSKSMRAPEDAQQAAGGALPKATTAKRHGAAGASSSAAAARSGSERTAVAKASKKSSWKQQSEMLRAAMRANQCAAACVPELASASDRCSLPGKCSVWTPCLLWKCRVRTR